MDKITLHDGDLSDSSSLIRIINIVQPDEIYNLAAQSHVQVSFDVPEYSGDVDALGHEGQPIRDRTVIGHGVSFVTQYQCATLSADPSGRGWLPAAQAEN